MDEIPQYLEVLFEVQTFVVTMRLKSPLAHEHHLVVCLIQGTHLGIVLTSLKQLLQTTV